MNDATGWEQWYDAAKEVHTFKVDVADEDLMRMSTVERGEGEEAVKMIKEGFNILKGLIPENSPPRQFKNRESIEITAEEA